MFVVNNALYKEIFDKMKRREQRKIKVCPVCYGDVIFIYDIYTSDIIRSLRDNRLLQTYLVERNIHGFWECQSCGRLWGIGTTKPIFELR